MNAPAHMPLPDWLLDDDDSRVEQQIRHELNSNRGFPAQGNQAALIELEKQSFGIAFESALEALAGGTTLTEFCHNYHMPISPVRFRTWMLQDNRRKNAYYGAKALWAEALEDELIRISDGVGPDGQRGSPSGGPSLPEDVQRSTLRIATRKWIMEKSNRKRYGDVKHIEQTTTNTTTIDVTTMSTEDLKRFVLRQAGADSLDADALDALTANATADQP